MRSAMLILLLLVTPTAGAAQTRWSEAALDTEVRRIASQLRCPRCQGLSIADSPDDLAVQMNVVIREQLVEGRTAGEIRDYFVSRYGEWVLLKPEPSGFNLVAYLGPILMMLAGAGFLVTRVRRWTTRSPPEAHAAGAPQPLQER